MIDQTHHKTNILHLQGSGNNTSLLKQLDIASKSTADLIYFLEDDYLHCESAMEEMIEDYKGFKRNVQQEVAIHPFDDPDNYKARYIEPTRIVLGEKRRYRLNSYSTFTFLCSPSVVRDNWDTLYKFSHLYMTPMGYSMNIHENTTINNIWREKTMLFTPIPSLALHMQYDDQKDKYINWKEWWDSV